MLLDDLNTLPLRARQALLSLIVVFAAYLAGWFFSSVVCRRLSAFAEKTAWKWDEVLVETLRQGIPVWTMLLGLIGTAVLRVKEFVDQYFVKHQFVKKLHARYQQEGIKIPFPTQVVIQGDAKGAS